MNKKIAKFSALLMSLYVTVFYHAHAFAQVATGYLGPKGTAETFAFRVINYVLAASGLVAVVYLIIGGFSYITSGGNEETTKKAVRTLLNAVIGLVVIFAAYAIVVTVQKVVLGGTLIPNQVITE